MAKKLKMTVYKEPEMKYSAGHDYYYGHGSRDAYELELNSVKAELRRTVYGDGEGGTSSYKEKGPRPVNGAAVALIIFAGLAILAIAIVGVLAVTGTKEFGLYDDSVALARGFVDKLSGIEIGIADTAALCAILGALFTLTTFFVSIAIVRSVGVGKGMVFGITITLVANVALTIAGMGGELPLIRIVLTVLSLLSLLTALCGGRKERKK